MVCIHHHSPLSLQKGQVGRYSDWKQSDETHPVEASYERMFVWASISGYRHPRSSPAGLTPRHRGVRHAQRPRSNNSAADHETQQWLRARGATQAAHGGGKPRETEAAAARRHAARHCAMYGAFCGIWVQDVSVCNWVVFI